MKQMCLDFGQRELGAVTCSRCGMVYQHEAQDEIVHRKHCKALAAENATHDDGSVSTNLEGGRRRRRTLCAYAGGGKGGKAAGASGRMC